MARASRSPSPTLYKLAKKKQTYPAKRSTSPSKFLPLISSPPALPFASSNRSRSPTTVRQRSPVKSRSRSRSRSRGNLSNGKVQRLIETLKSYWNTKEGHSQIKVQFGDGTMTRPEVADKEGPSSSKPGPIFPCPGGQRVCMFIPERIINTTVFIGLTGYYVLQTIGIILGLLTFFSGMLLCQCNTYMRLQSLDALADTSINMSTTFGTYLRLLLPFLLMSLGMLIGEKALGTGSFVAIIAALLTAAAVVYNL